MLFSRNAIKVCLGLFALWATSASASSLYLADNLSESNDGSAGLASGLYLAESFTTDATHTKITEVTTPLNREPNATGTVYFYIYSSDGSNNPGTLVATLGSLDVASQLTTSIANYTLSSLNVSLSANTQYYLVLTSTSTLPDITYWIFTGSTSGTGFPSYYSSRYTNGSPAWSTPSLTSPQQMRIQAEGSSSSSVPELDALSGTGALTLVGLALSLTGERRRRRA